MTAIDELLDDAANLGRDRIIFPIDILQLATKLANHPDRLAAVPGLIVLLGHDWNFQRHVALRALRLMGSDAVTGHVVNLAATMLQSDDAPNVRAEAARLLAMAGRGHETARTALAQAAGDDDTDYVRQEATRALKALRAASA